MIVVDRLSPFLWHTQFHGHDIGLRWYGLSYLLGFVLAYLFFRRAAARAEVAGFGPDDVEPLVVRLVIGVMVGGRVGFVVQHPIHLLHDPLFLIAIWQGGMAFFGGLAGVMIGIWSYARQKKISFIALTDVCAQPAALALGIGRIANFANGELVGRPTGHPLSAAQLSGLAEYAHGMTPTPPAGVGWGFIFPNVDAVPRHPSQLYECVAHLLLFLALFLLYQKWVRKIRPGAISYLFLIGYGATRFITDFWRQDDTYWGPFSDGQWFSLLIALGGVVALWVWRRQGASRAASPAPPPE